jgi:hypothetical protein
VGRKPFVQQVFGKCKFWELRSTFKDLAEKMLAVALKSALEDFETTTLGAIPGLLAKLHYIAALHDGHGSYAHWGMGRVHGEEAARRAIRTAHAAVLTQVLRTSLRVLDEDLRRSASSGQVAAMEFLGSLKKLAPQALPNRAAPASEKHLRAVLHALSALLRSPERASHLDASPPPPPVR